jgi:Raf kinase inhibitor-like YbhB/YbcL family protein
MLENLPEQVGHALQHQRAGIDSIALHRLLLERHVERIEVRSSAFEHMTSIPTRYTADADGISPPLAWRGIPDSAACVVLMVEDADSPTPRPLVHAIAVNLPCNEGSLAEGALMSPDGAVTDQVEVGLNSLLKQGWLPPDPPPGHGEHRYAFQLFGLREGARFSRVPGRQELFDAILERAIAGGLLIGTYERPKRQEIGATEQDEVTLAADFAAELA